MLEMGINIPVICSRSSNNHKNNISWFLSIITDVAAFIILWIAIARYDYCLAITYVILNLVEVFALIVVLGYYL
jgi:hypothetical protein